LSEIPRDLLAEREGEDQGPAGQKECVGKEPKQERPIVRAERHPLGRNGDRVLGSGMVSVVVSIRMRKMFAEVCKIFLKARNAEQDVREAQAGYNF
jgi:hypothetical protein